MTDDPTDQISPASGVTSDIPPTCSKFCCNRPASGVSRGERLIQFAIANRRAIVLLILGIVGALLGVDLTGIL